MGVGKKIFLIILVLLAVCTFALANKLFGDGDTRPSRDEQGNALHNGIALLEKVSLDGLDQWILIRGALGPTGIGEIKSQRV